VEAASSPVSSQEPVSPPEPVVTFQSPAVPQQVSPVPFDLPTALPPDPVPAPGFQPFVPNTESSTQPPLADAAFVPALPPSYPVSSPIPGSAGFAEQPTPLSVRNILIFRGGERDGDIIRLDTFAGGECAVGRSDVPENQVVIRDDLKVSRLKHAIFECDDLGRYAVRDNNSANKVFVNENCIDVGPVALNSGDRIRIGLTEFEYVQEPIS